MADVADLAEIEIERVRDVALSRHRQQMLAVTAPTSDRNCVLCGEAIGMDRLRVVPHTLHCIDCAQTRERQEKGRR